jgi:AcrR family transcriptional regulator
VEKRREPVQSRSQKRLDAILDAADALFLEMGYANTTTNHVAARAGTSIGSLYRFFPNKESILVALASRYVSRIGELGAQLGTPGDGATIRSLISQGVDTFADFLLANRGFLTIMQEFQNPVLRPVVAEYDASMIAVLSATQAAFAPHQPEEERNAVARVLMISLGALQGFAMMQEASFRRCILQEIKELVSGYLSRRLGFPEDAPISFPPGSF